jgi:transposase
MTPPNVDNLDQANQVIAELVATVDKLQGQVEWLTRQLFGRKSERWSGEEQTGLFAGMVANDDTAAAVDVGIATQTVAYEREAPISGGGGGGRGKREPIPDHLPRETRIHDLPEHEKTGMKRIGEEVSEQLALEPGRVYVIRHVRYTYARVEESLDGSESNVVTASKPDEGLPRCIAAPSLLAYVAVSKHADHVPLYRQGGILQRSGVELSRSSMCRWMQDLATLCVPLLALMKNRVLQSHVIQADETPVKQQIGGKGPTKTCYFWSYVGDDISGGPYILYDYQQNRSRAGPNRWFSDEHGLPNYHGYLQCDAYAGYNDLFAPATADKPWAMTHIGCLAHVRRKYYDVRMQFPAACHHVLGQIKLLYDVERDAKELQADERQALRDRKSRPILADLLNWCGQQQQQTLPKSGLGEAITYTLNQAQSLQRYLDDGRLAVDNNRCERSLRGIAIGRRNWMFTGSDAGGRAAAAMFSLISSARRNNVEPLNYLTDVFTRLPAAPISQLDQFLPDRWQSRST